MNNMCDNTFPYWFFSCWQSWIFTYEVLPFDGPALSFLILYCGPLNAAHSPVNNIGLLEYSICSSGLLKLARIFYVAIIKFLSVMGHGHRENPAKIWGLFFYLFIVFYLL